MFLNGASGGCRRVDATATDFYTKTLALKCRRKNAGQKNSGQPLSDMRADQTDGLLKRVQVGIRDDVMGWRGADDHK